MIKVEKGSRTTVSIVGSGAFGISAALELNRRGYLVTVIDPTVCEGPHPLASSTDISKIIRTDYGSDTLYNDMVLESVQKFRAWNQKWGEDLYHETGLLILSQEAMKEGSFAGESYRCITSRGFPVDRMDGTTLHKRFPEWNSSGIVYNDNYINHCGGWAESGRIVAKLTQEAKEQGVILLQAQMKQLIYSKKATSDGKQKVIGIELVDGRELRSDFVVVAAGAFTPHLLPWLQSFITPTLHPVFHFKPKPGSNLERLKENSFPTFAADIEHTGYYGFPLHPKAGVIKVANHSKGLPLLPKYANHKIYDSTFISQMQKEHYETELKKVRAFLKGSLPSLVDAEVTFFRFCLYSDTQDGHFLIDQDPNREGLVIATGGSGHGFKFLPVIGDIVADVLERKPNKYAERFQWRTVTSKQYDVCRFAPEENTNIPKSKL